MEQKLFKGPVADMLDTGRTHRGHFIIYKADFITFDTGFNDPYDANWLASIEASENYETAETRDDQQQQETAEVAAEMKAAFKCYGGMKFFIVKAFETKPNIMNKFGLNDYSNARGSQKLMKMFMGNLYEQATAYSADLLAVNCPQTRIDEILTIKNSLTDEDTQQNVFITSETVATDARNKQYNATFLFDRLVNRASKVVFYDDPVKLNLFLFPRHSEPAETFNVLGNVRDSVTNLPLAAVEVGLAIGAAPSFISTTTDINGDYGFAAIADGSYTLKFAKAGYIPLSVNITVTAGVVTIQDVLMVPAP